MKKKGLLGLAMCAMLVAPAAGCNKDKVEGVYVFDSVEILEESVTKSYTCSASDKASSEIVANSCASIGDGKVEWKIDEDVAYFYAIDNNGNELGGDTRIAFEYKIEDNVFKVKPKNSTEDSENYGTLKNGKLTITGGLQDGAALVFEKE